MEIWRDIEGYKGLYQVSDKGNIKSLEREIFTGKYYKTIKESIKKQHIGKNGYMQILLSKNGEKHPKDVHRIVAQTFIPNPNNLPQVNHKDECKTNNSVENLEWCDRKYNCNYGNRNNKVKGLVSKKVFMYDLNDNLIEVFNSTVDASEKLEMSQAGISYACLTNKEMTKKHKGYYLSYN